MSRLGNVRSNLILFYNPENRKDCEKYQICFGWLELKHIFENCLQILFANHGPVCTLCQIRTFRYTLPSLNLYVPFANLGPSGTPFQPWTFRYPLPTLCPQVPLANLGPLGTLCQPWTLRYPLSN